MAARAVGPGWNRCGGGGSGATGCAVINLCLLTGSVAWLQCLLVGQDEGLVKERRGKLGPAGLGPHVLRKFP